MKALLEMPNVFDKYVYNALSVFPTMILAPVDELSIGALLSLVR
jgi:hypothetical protein